jgi:hypothetical protein
MAGIFRDSFRGYTGSAAPVGLGAKWESISGVSLVTGRFGGQAVQCDDGNQGMTSRNFDAASASVGLCVGFKVSNTGGAYSRILFMSDTTAMFGIGFNADGSITAYRQTATGSGATALGTSDTGIIQESVWYTLELKATVSDTTGSVAVKIDNVEVLNLSNVDTRNGTPTTVNRVRLQSAITGGGTTFDSLYITDQNAYLTKPVRSEVLLPSSDGATLNWAPSTGTDHFAVVDEVPVSTTDYLSASVVGDVDELGLTNLASTPASIEEVNVVFFASKTDAVARDIYLGVKSGSTNSDGTGQALTSTGIQHERPLATDPDTAVAWTASGVNALQLRPKVAV